MNKINRLIILSLILLLPTGLIFYQLYSKSTQDSKANSNSISSLEIDHGNDLTKDSTIPKYEYTAPSKELSEEEGKLNYTYKDDYSEEKEYASDEKDIISIENTASVFKDISIDSYKLNLETTKYKVQSGNTISKILRNYENTCNYKSALKHLKLINPEIDLDNLEIGSILNLPTTAFRDGSLYKVSKGDTWYKISKLNYPNYNTDDMVEFLISINDLPNSELPLDENVFLPNL